MKTITLTFASFALLSAGFSTAFLEPAAAVAGDRHHKSSTRTAPAHQSAQREMPAAGQANRQPNRHFPPNYYLNRPLGSATSTPRGFYRDNLSYDPPPRDESDEGRTVYVPQPVYYVVPPLFPGDANSLSFGDVRGPADQAVDPDQLGAASSRPVVIEADNIYVVPPDDPRLDRTPRHAVEDYRASSAPIERPVGNYGSVPTQAPDPAPAEPAQPEEPQLVSLSIQPADAVVWLDDEELGLAGELASSVVLEPGVYLLEVEHDELDDQRLFFGVVDQAVDVRVDLTADVPRRRYRVR